MKAISTDRMSIGYFYRRHGDKSAHRKLNALCEWGYITEEDYKKYETLLLDGTKEDNEIIHTVIECCTLKSDEKVADLKYILDGLTR